MFSHLRKPENKLYITHGARRMGFILTFVTALLTIGLFVLSPVSLGNPYVWILCAMVFIITVRGTLSRKVIAACAKYEIKNKTAIWYLVLLNVALSIPLILYLFLGEAKLSAWYLLGGFAVSSLLEGYGLWKERGQILQPRTPKACDPQKLHDVNAYRIFQKIILCTTVALQLTLVIAYVFIVRTAGLLLTCMLIAAVFTLASREMTEKFLSHPRLQEKDPANVLMVGLVLWLAGLSFFVTNMINENTLQAYFSLVFCTCGATMSMTVLSRMEDDVRRIAAFATDTQPDDTYDYMQAIRMEYATLLGQLIALLGISTIFLFHLKDIDHAFDYISLETSLLLTLPATAMLAAAFISTLQFPVTAKYLGKLRHFFRLMEEGENNAPLHDQLEEVVVKHGKRHIGVKIIMFVLRPLYYHRLCGKENMKFDDNTSTILLCNHGELYGPIVTNLYIPANFRPWTISDIMDPAEVTGYLYKYTFSRQKWLLPCLRMPVAKVAARACVWIMRSMECIPVYRNKPRMLMQTFRESVAAMEAGDNLLIFPENPNADMEHQGYSHDGTVGEFFTGFVMLGSMYYDRTGKRVNFLPIYASKQKRTITFGESIRYDPDALPVPEKQRIVDHLRAEMQRMAQTDRDETTPPVSPTESM